MVSEERVCPICCKKDPFRFFFLSLRFFLHTTSEGGSPPTKCGKKMKEEKKPNHRNTSLFLALKHKHVTSGRLVGGWECTRQKSRRASRPHRGPPGKKKQPRRQGGGARASPRRFSGWFAPRALVGLMDGLRGKKSPRLHPGGSDLPKTHEQTQGNTGRGATHGKGRPKPAASPP